MLLGPLRWTEGLANYRLAIFGALLCLLTHSPAPAWCQQVGNNNSNNNTTQVISRSDLANQNMSRVAASAAEIKSILLKEPGLLVELKRWVAKDSTDHGQIVGETELSDYAIFDRLESDIHFRSIATVLVQRYGFLIPKINPESDLAKDRGITKS